MKINEIIREKRIARGMTQEQMAAYLGVSAPAVNKWEKAVSYPDITLLPALARLLETDLNTLLSFKENLTDEEIGAFTGEICMVAMEEGRGIADAFALAEEKIREYPSCDKLVLNAALALEGVVLLTARAGMQEQYLPKIEEMYKRAANSKDAAVKYHAKSMLVSKHKERGEYEEAERLLEELPDETLYDKKMIQSNLYLAEGRTEEAAQIIERKMMSDISGVVSGLLTLMEIAMKEDRKEDVEMLAQTAKQTIRLYDLWEYEEYAVDFQVAMAKEDASQCLVSLESMFAAMQKMEDVSVPDSALYRHLPVKNSAGKQAERSGDQVVRRAGVQDREGVGAQSRKGAGTMGEMLMSNLIQEMKNAENQEYDFLRRSDEFCAFLSRWEKETVIKKEYMSD